MTERGLLRVGHKGADLIAPGNTRASFDAALAAGVDMIEFDVLPVARRRAPAAARPRLDDASRRTPHTLEEGLAHLASTPFAGIELDIDLKLPGYELRVLEALREHGLLARALISSQYRVEPRVIRRPNRASAWAGRCRSCAATRSASRALRSRRTLVGLALREAALPIRAARAIRAGRCDALMAHWRLVTP